MGQASSSSASTAAINSTGGNITNTEWPGLSTWLVLGGIVIFLVVLWKRL